MSLLFFIIIYSLLLRILFWQIVGREGEGNNPKRWHYWVRWLGYEPSDDSLLPYSQNNDLEDLDEYLRTIQMDIPEWKGIQVSFYVWDAEQSLGSVAKSWIPKHET